MRCCGETKSTYVKKTVLLKLVKGLVEASLQDRIKRGESQPVGFDLENVAHNLFKALNSRSLPFIVSTMFLV